MQYFKSIMPPKLGNVVDCKNIPINTEAVAYENRIKKIFIKFFGKGMIEEEAYWKLLWNMVNDPYKLYGIVGIDGFANDMSAKNDYGLYLNFGKPRLRARKYHNLKRIYGYIIKSGDVHFFNSKVETKDNQHFMMNKDNEYNLWSADHPHISSSVPCLGAYQNDLGRWRHEGNPIMYLKTINQFLNTWNARSAYHNINHTPTVYTLTKDKVKPRVFSRGTYLMYSTSNREYHNNCYNFITKHIFDIKSEDRQSELSVIDETRKILHKINESLLENNINLQGSKHINYINMFIDVTGTPIHRRSNDINWELINRGFDRGGRNVIDRYISIKDGNARFPIISEAKTTYGILNSHKSYIALEKHTDALGKTMRQCIKECINNNSTKTIISKYEKVAIQKYIETIVPIIIEKNQVYADLTVKHSLSSRINDNSNVETEELGKIRASLIRKYKLANAKLFKEVLTSVKDECDLLKIDDMLNKAVKTAFECEWNDEDTDHKYLFNKGHYYDYTMISTLKEKKNNEEKLKIDKWPTTFEELINLYEDSKRKSHLIFLEAEEETIKYKKRKVVESYGYNITNTKQDSTQVPLSFEAVS